MPTEGPLVEYLTHRLAECPPEFLAEPVIGNKGRIQVDAVVSDLVLDLGGELLSERGAGPFVTSLKDQRNFLRLSLISTWVLHDEWFRQKGGYGRPAYGFLKNGLKDLAGLVAAERFVMDPDRREELVRLILAALDLIPAGETMAQAADRLKTMGSVERSRVLEETKKAEEHAKQVREAMRRKKAREAAAKVNHE